METELLHQQLRDASLQAQGQRETAAIFKHKYAAAMEKVQRVQGRAELLEEELRYSQQQVDTSLTDNNSKIRTAVTRQQKHCLPNTCTKFSLVVTFLPPITRLTKAVNLSPLSLTEPVNDRVFLRMPLGR